MNELVLTGSIAALGAGAVTGVGSLPIYFVSHITQRVKAGFFGFASGIMLAASFFSLLIPGIEQGQLFWGSKAAGVGAALIGFLFGGSFVHWSSRLLLHDDALIHAVFKQKDDSGILRRVFLIVFTITMHNFPEGLSIGVSYGAGNAERSLALALGIGLQNIPEGTVIAMSLLMAGYRPLQACVGAFLAGLIEPLAGLLGIVLVTFFQPVLPIALGFAAGSMIYVVLTEMAPEILDSRVRGPGVLAFFIGFSIMSGLDVILG